MVSVRYVLIIGIIQILHVEARPPFDKIRLPTLIPSFIRTKSKRVTPTQMAALQQRLDDYIKEQSEKTSSMAAKMAQMEAVLKEHSRATKDQQNAENKTNSQLATIETRLASLTSANIATENFKKNMDPRLARLQAKLSNISSGGDLVETLDRKVSDALKTLSALDGRVRSAEDFLDRLRDAPDCPMTFQWDKKSELCAVVHTAAVARKEVNCRKYGTQTRLVIPDTKAKFDAVNAFLVKAKVSNSFLGGKMSSFYSDFYWDNGKSILVGWCPHAPSSHKSCLVMNSPRDSCLEDVDCEQPYPYICELTK